jgi:hypothetical protein
MNRREFLQTTGAVALATALPIPAIAKVTRETAFVKFVRNLEIPGLLVKPARFVPTKLTYDIGNWMDSGKGGSMMKGLPRQSGKTTHGLLWTMFVKEPACVIGRFNIHEREMKYRADLIVRTNPDSDLRIPWSYGVGMGGIHHMYYDEPDFNFRMANTFDYHPQVKSRLLLYTPVDSVTINSSGSGYVEQKVSEIS